MSNNFLACITCLTYNQAPYITDALNGFTMQQTTFPYIAMVVDDASTDGEQKVITQYVEENFDTNNSEVAYKKETDYAHITYAQHKTNKNCYIVVLYLKENLYSKGLHDKKLEYLSQWRDNTKYEALCEGDDYWIDPLKLQKQVDFLENNPEYGMCYTKVKSFNQEKKQYTKVWGGPKEDYNSLINANVIPTLSVLLRLSLRKQYIHEINPSKQKWQMGDYPMWLWYALNSRIKFIDNITGIYRILNNSASHSTDINKREAFIFSIYEMKMFFLNRYGGLSLSELHDSKYRSLMSNSKTHYDFTRAIGYYNKIYRKNLKDKIKALICYINKFMN